SRLIRTDKDFCRLLEVCQIFDTLVGEDDQVYDLNLMDDQLVLGIKGTLSVVELKQLDKRLQAGRKEKALQGKLVQRLPPGYVQNPTGEVVLDPDERIQEAIRMVFSKYRELWSVRQTCQWFWVHELKLPVNKCLPGGVRLVWQLPKSSYIQEMLSNPYYAGAYFWGRGATKTVFEDGRLVKKRTRPARRPEDCFAFIWDHHEGYIDRRTYEENQEMMSRNQLRGEGDPAVAAVRSGQGLLAGLLRCGRCGHKYHVRYSGCKGTSSRYFCVGDYDEGGNYCNSFAGRKVDQRIGEEILAAISPLGIEASLAALEKLRAEDDEERRSLVLELEQVDYEAQRAFEQYDEVDPRNRRVAKELERRWNVKLEERDRVQAAIAAVEARNRPLSAEEEKKVRGLGEDFARVWGSENCPIELKKKIAWTVIEEIIADVVEGENAEVVRMVIHWKGGAHTSLEMPKAATRIINKTSSDALDVIRKMADRYADGEIAAVLNRLGYRTGKDLRWNQTRVSAARRSQSIPGHTKPRSDPEILSLAQAAAYCEVPMSVIKRLVRNGLLTNGQVVPVAPWELRRSELDSEPVRGILARYRQTGRYCEEGGLSPDQKNLFTSKQES
ncbi:MAG: recombinase family protein, partial [Gemmatimonadota bacterium]